MIGLKKAKWPIAWQEIYARLLGREKMWEEESRLWRKRLKEIRRKQGEQYVTVCR